MALAGTLEIQMLANLARLQKDMDEAKRIVGGAMSSIERNVKSVMGLFGVAFSAGMFISIVKNSIDAADKLNDLSKSTGIAVTELAGLKLAAAQSGGDLNSVADSINKLSVNMGKDAERFKALGITAKDPLEAFKQLADVFKLIEDPQQRAAVAAAALGKSWAGAAPLLAEGGAKIQEMVDEGARLSGMTQEMADRSDEFNDSIAKLQTQLGGVGTSLANQLLPTLIDVTKELNNFNSSGNGLISFSEVIGEVFKVLVVLGANVGYVFKQAAIELQGMAAELAAIAKMDFKGAGQISKMMKEDAAFARAEIDAFSERIMNPPKATQQAKGLPSAADVKAAANAAKAAAEFLKTNEAQQKIYDSLLAKIKEYDAGLLQQLETGKKLTEADKLAIQAKEKLTIAQQASLAILLAKAKADEDALAAEQQFEKLEGLATGRRAEQNDALDKNLQSILDGTKAMRESTAEIGLSADALTALKLARIDDTIAIEQRKLAILDNGFETEEIAKIRETIAALEDRKQSVVGQAAANMKGVLADNITGGIMAGFESGSSYPKIFEDMVNRMFKDMVLEPTIKASITAGVDWVQQLIVSSTTTTTNTTSIVALTAAVNANTAAQGTSGAGSATGGALGGSSSGLGTAVTIGTYAALAYLVYGFFESHGYSRTGISGSAGAGGVNARGYQSRYDGGSFFNPKNDYSITYFNLTAQQLAALNSSFKKVGDTVIQFADQLQLSTEAVKNYTTAFDISGTQDSIDRLFKRISDEMIYGVMGVDIQSINAKYPNSVVHPGSETGVYNLSDMGDDFGITFRKLREQYLAEITASLPSWFNQLRKDGESVADTFNRVGLEIQTVDSIWKTFGYDTAKSFGALGEGLQAINAASIQAREALIAQAGGMDAFVKQENDFFNLTFTQAEKDAINLQAAKDSIAKTFAELGLSIPGSMEEFRNLRGSLDLTTEAGRQAYAVITGAAGSFAVITDAAAKARKELESMFKKETFSTMIDYLRAVGRAANSALNLNIPAANNSVLSPITVKVPNDTIMPISNAGREKQIYSNWASENGELVVEVKAMRQEISLLRVSNDLTARSSKKTSDVLTGVTQGDLSLNTVAA